MGTFPTGVTVVAALDGEGGPVGLTVNSFTSVSLDPPLVLVCIDRGSGSHDVLLDAGSFTVNVLAGDQGEVAARFATDPAHQRFDDLPWRPGPTGAPVLEGAASWLACVLDARHPGGDHSILVGRVVAGEVGAAPSLLFYRGDFRDTGA